MDTQALQEGLAEQIRLQVDNNLIFKAFRCIPRHRFVPFFLDRASRKDAWRRITSENDQEEWLSKIYSNKPLVTSVDELDFPNCSSSQPSLMALMMESVDIKPTDTVLEIGTGTGYNASLLASIVGASNVTTIEINETLLADAAQRIELVIGPGVRCIHGDGRHLPTDNDDKTFANKFDVIIVTGAHERIEPDWIQALKPDGRIIMNWIKSFANVMLSARKVGNGLVGCVEKKYRGDFMGLHDEDACIPRTRILLEQTLNIEGMAFPIHLLDDPSFRLFIQINIPTLRYTSYTKKSGNIHAIREGERITILSQLGVGGDRSLAEELQGIAQKFELLRKPRYHDFALAVDADGEMTFTYEDHSYAVRGQGFYS